MKITLLTGPTYDLEALAGFPLRVVRSNRARRLTLRIDEKTRRPVLTLPPRCSNAKALAFIETHRDWVTNMLAKLPPRSTWSHGALFSLMGRPVTIEHCPEGRFGVRLEEDRLQVSGKEEFLPRRITDYIKKFAGRELWALSCQKAALLGCRVQKVAVKDTRTRWGSCSNRGNINYNWRIVLAPAEVIDYLVSHEVAHLRHQDHSADFWSTVAGLCPGYREGRAWLKVKGRMLYQYA